ncbi:gamma-glutamyltransferase [Bremerella alba]|uniref:Glutathione hydrolase proenzyme n=1 Tax=Bremerella alba TaxID=980252 RepID=A0A7V8V270_9BACT|nr:gamma-glutamyltransferase [Bremerella alba]MBA2113565.1 Glutathione hydrolase proenzyme [Bremerella alba]
MIRYHHFCTFALFAIGGLLSNLVSPTLSAEEIVRPPRKPVEVVQGKLGVVTSDTPLASEVGRDILAKGGNAVDAAIGVAFALEVTWPEAGNIGGGGFMMIAPPDEEVVCINYREKSPANVDTKSFVNWKQRKHIRMAGVPGTVRGMALAHEKYGKLPWHEIIAPSIDLAREGIVVDPYLAYSLNLVFSVDYIQKLPRFAEFRRVYGNPNGRPWKPGDKLVQADLAKTLTLIAEDGPSVFYEGAIAQKIAAESKRGGGLITLEDLKQYTAQVLPAVEGEIGPYTVFGAPLPSSGGTTVLMQLRMLEALEFPTQSDDFWTVEQVHLMTEVMRRGFRERAAWLGDPDFVTVPTDITSEEHAWQLASTIDTSQATPSEDIAGDIPLAEGPYESSETTHFSVIDKDGLAVSNTYTLESTYGCRIVVPGTGMLLNNEMGDFNWYPGYTDRKGKIGTEPNLIAPGKRMLSSQSPTIVRENGKTKLLIGSPGGRTIINTVTEIVMQTLILDRPLDEAIDGPRFHHQWFPDAIRFEASDNGLFDEMKPKLEAMGHEIEANDVWRQGCANGIIVDLETGEARGVSDWRRGGGARAVE